MDKTPVRIAKIEEIIERASHVSIRDMRSHKRDRPFAEARMAVWFIARDHLGFSFKMIARVYKRDHTTIMHGVKKMRSDKLGELILSGIKKNCPEVLKKPANGETRTVENWEF